MMLLAGATTAPVGIGIGRPLAPGHHLALLGRLLGPSRH